MNREAKELGEPTGSDMRKLLLICPYFPPTAASGAHRMLGFARHLPKFGWDVSVVACAPVWWEPQDDGLARLIPAQTVVTYVDFPKGRIANWIATLLGKQGIADNYWFWCRSARGTCNRLLRTRPPDVILTSGPPHSTHLLGLELKRQFGLPWVVDFRDPWLAEQSRGNNDRFKHRWEAAVIEYADAVIANAPRALADIQQAYRAAADKMRCITNGYDPESFPRRMNRTLNRDIELVHTGELYAERDPRPLLDALSRLRVTAQSSTPYRVTFVGSTEWCGLDLDEEVKRRGCCSLVEFTGHLPYEDAKRLMADADILLLLDTAGRRSGVPAKLYEYLGCKRPILALAENDGDTAWVLRKSGVPHRIVQPHDVAGIHQAFTELRELANWCGDKCSTLDGVAAFTREETARELARVMDGLRAHSLINPVSTAL